MQPPHELGWCVLPAGGIGARLAPLSTPERPKQVLPLLPDGRSPLRATWERVVPLFQDRVLVSTGRPMLDAVRQQLPELPDDRFLVEPEGRNTLAPLIWATAEVDRRGGIGLTSVHADHFVDDDAAYRDTILRAWAAAADGAIALAGLQPDHAATGLGWIVRGPESAPGVHQVARFVEKPGSTVAEQLLQTGALWNLGLFCWRGPAFVEALAHGVEGGLAAFRRLTLGEPVESVWPDIPKISVDHGLITHAPRLVVVPARFGWTDLGSFEAIEALGQG